MNWASPRAPTGLTTLGFHPDSASIWAAKNGAAIRASRAASRKAGTHSWRLTASTRNPRPAGAHNGAMQ